MKSSETSIGDPDLSQFHGKVANDEFGLFVALGGFLQQARRFAASKGNLRLIDGDELVQLIFEKYVHLSSKYHGIFPMRRVYVPEAIKSED